MTLATAKPQGPHPTISGSPAAGLCFSAAPRAARTSELISLGLCSLLVHASFEMAPACVLSVSSHIAKEFLPLTATPSQDAPSHAALSRTGFFWMLLLPCFQIPARCVSRRLRRARYCRDSKPGNCSRAMATKVVNRRSPCDAGPRKFLCCRMVQYYDKMEQLTYRVG